MDKRFLIRGEAEDDDIHSTRHENSPRLCKRKIWDLETYGSQGSLLNIKICLASSLILNLILISVLFVQGNPRISNGDILRGHTIATHFEARKEYMSLDHSYDIYWEELLINKSHWPALALGADNDIWLGRATITMIHQLHCLQMLREVLQQAKEGMEIGADWRDNTHWPHCFDTLLQHILCYADDTIERPDIDAGVVGHAISGYGVERQCRDPVPIYELFEDKGIIWPPPN